MDLAARQLSLHMTWVRKAIECPEWEYIYHLLNSKLGKTIWKFNLTGTHARRICNVKNSFGVDILIEWSEIHYHKPQTYEELVEEFFVCNSLVLVGNDVIFPLDEMLSKDILQIKHLINDNNELMSHIEFEIYHGIRVPWLWYCSLVKSISLYWINLLQSQNMQINKEQYLNVQDILRTTKTVSQVVYSHLIYFQLDTPLYKYANKWMNTLNIQLGYENYRLNFKKLYKITNVAKL